MKNKKVTLSGLDRQGGVSEPMLDTNMETSMITIHGTGVQT